MPRTITDFPGEPPDRTRWIQDPELVAQVMDNVNDLATDFDGYSVTVYASATGDDDTGDGSEEAPFRTFQRAASKVPLLKDATIILTDLDEEALPAGYTLPPWQGDVAIIATQRPATALTAEQRTVTVTTATANDDKTIEVTDESQAWEVDALKGYFVSYGDPEDPLISVIYGNTADTLYLSGNDTDPVVLDADEVMTITEPSATLLTEGGMYISGAAFLYIAGVTIEPSDEEGGLSVSDSTVIIERSVLTKASFEGAPVQYYVTSCYGSECYFASRLYLSRGVLVDSGVMPFARPAQTGLLIHSGQVLDGSCVQIDDGRVGVPVGGVLSMDGVLIRNAPADSVKLNGGFSSISNVTVNDGTGNAFSFVGPGKHVLTNVTGSGSTGVGTYVTDGAQVECENVDVTGVGGDQEVGGLGADDYPADPYNIVDWTYDPTGGAPAQITGTGARLFHG